MMDYSKSKNQAIVVFESRQIRRDWHQDEWYFSVVDVVAVLTEQTDSLKARKYWNKLAQRLRNEGSEVVTNCHQMKLKAPDGKMRKTDCANTEGIFRIIQSIPSPKNNHENTKKRKHEIKILSFLCFRPFVVKNLFLFMLVLIMQCHATIKKELTA